MKNLSKNGKILFIVTLILSIFGVLMVYSASYVSANAQYSDKYFYASKQLYAFFLGLIGMIIVSKIRPNFYKKFAIPVYLFGIIILSLVFIPGLGVTSYGATRWIQIAGFSFQPSELAKFCLVLFLAYFISKNDITNSLKNCIKVLIYGGIYCVLIIIEPNMSITICVGLCMMLMLFAGGAKLKFFTYSIIPILILAVVLILIEPYRMSRIIAFLDPWENSLAEGYQLIQSLYAISSGGLFGVGLFCSRQAHLFLPFAESDFIFAIIIEELGIIGGLFVLTIFYIMLKNIFHIAKSAKTKFEKLLCIGIAIVIFTQVVLNIAVVTGCVPPTGLPLPFISAGGSALFVFMSAIGVVLGVDIHSRKQTFVILNSNNKKNKNNKKTRKNNK